MSYRVLRTEMEIDNLLNQCVEAMHKGSKYPGLTYEQGIEAALCWALNLGRDSDHPLDD